MNIALIIAGGSGTRMHQDIPKQFLTVNERPVIVYTMQAFQEHPDLDAIAVVCLKGWEQILQAYARQFNITKLKHIIPGGENGQASIRNGVFELEKYYCALECGIIGSVASCTLMAELGEQVYFSAGSEKNLKLTTVEEIEIFKALLHTKRSDRLK